MSGRFEVPQTSEEVGNQVYHQFISNMGKFASELVPQVEQEQPEFLDGNLQGAIAIMLAEETLPAVMMLSGSFFRYECARREMEAKGETLPYIGKETFVRSTETFRELRDLVVQFGRSDAMLRRIAVQLSNEDPFMGELVNKMLEQPIEVQRQQAMDAFIQGIHTTHTQLGNIDSTRAPEPEVIETNQIPMINRTLVRQVLLDVLYDPEGFTKEVLDFLEDSIPVMASRIKSIGEKDYELLAAFTSSCIIREIQDRDLPLGIRGGVNLSHPNPRLAKLMTKKYPTIDDKKEIIDLLEFHTNEAFEEIRSTNPHFHWGVMPFLNAYMELDSARRFDAGRSAVVQQYDTLKSILKIG